MPRTNLYHLPTYAGHRSGMQLGSQAAPGRERRREIYAPDGVFIKPDDDFFAN